MLQENYKCYLETFYLIMTKAPNRSIFYFIVINFHFFLRLRLYFWPEKQRKMTNDVHKINLIISQIGF